MIPMRPKNTPLRYGLKELIADVHLPEIRMIELGSYRGESAEVFLAEPRVKQLICIDIWDAPDDHTRKLRMSMGKNGAGMTEVEQDFDTRLTDHIKEGRLFKLKGTGILAHEMLKDEYFDLIYIDAAHDYDSVKRDLKNYIPKLKPNGYIAGHDYGHGWTGVIQAVDELNPVIKKTYRDSSYLMLKSDIR